MDAAELRGLGTEQLRAHALEAGRTFAALVDRKASPEEAEGAKRWLIGIAERTAEAAKEGGFLGFGGTQVNPAETAAIQEVARTLGVSGPL